MPSKPNWYNELHEEALSKATDEWSRPNLISDRPEVIRDLVRLGLLNCRNIKKGRGEISYYRLAA